MTVVNAFGMFVGMIVLLVLLCWGIVWMERKFPGKQYDERQHAARGNAYRVSFWVSCVYMLAVMVYMIYQVESGETPVEGYLLLFTGVMLHVMVFHIYCLLTHSALPLSQKPIASVFIYSFLAFTYTLYIFDSEALPELPLTGKESFIWVWVISAVCFFSLALMHLIRLLWKEKE